MKLLCLVFGHKIDSRITYLLGGRYPVWEGWCSRHRRWVPVPRWT